MNGRAIAYGPALILAGALLSIGSAALAQQNAASAATRSLNSGAAQSTMSTRANAQQPLAAPQRPPASAPRRERASDRTLEDLLGETRDRPADRNAPADDAEARTGVTLAAGQTEPDPIPVTLGYYVRGDMDCAEVWPGGGDLAWMSPTSFAIDFGGCEPGQFLQTGPNSWREEQRCHTELGGDAGGYMVSYEVLDAGLVKRTARLALDGSVEEDEWKACRTQDVPEEARFKS